MRKSLGVLWLLAVAALAAALTSCAGVKVPPTIVDQVTCLAQKGAWDPDTNTCTLPTPPTPKPDPCEGKAPRCVQQSDTDCYAMNKDGVCQLWTKEPLPLPTVPPPTPAPVPTPTPAPPPTSGCVYPPEPALVPLATQHGESRGDAVRAAIKALKAAGQDGGEPAVALERLAAHLRGDGLCAFAGKEAVFVQNAVLEWEEYHAVYFGDGKYIDSGKYIGAHNTPGPFTPQPLPTPAPAPTPAPVTDACPSLPCPARVWTAETLPPGWGQDEIGQPAWRWKSAVWGGHFEDHTPVTIRQLAYCQSIGFNDPSQPPRAECPMRKDEGQDKVAVERWLLQGDFTIDSRNGAECAFEGHPSMTVLSADCRMCNSSKTVCSADWK